MKRRLYRIPAFLASTLVAAVMLSGVTVSSSHASLAQVREASGESSPAIGTAASSGRQASGQSSYIVPPCAKARRARMRCFLAYRRQLAVNAAIRAGLSGRAARPKGLGALALRDAYKLPMRRASDQTVAISIAFHTPNLGRYLAVYRKQFGLRACTVASGCLRQVNQAGKTAPPAPSGKFTGWDLEAVLDVSMVSAACPECRILVVEAKDASFANLAASERTAARLGAQVISNSYGSDETGESIAFRKSYRQPGHAIVVSSGDLGFGIAQNPADLSSVISVGGTILTRAANKRGWQERTWNQPKVGAGGSGCSAWIAKPAWQHDGRCPMRTVADVAAVASNVAIFDPTYGGWLTVAGTSISAPLTAGIIGLAGNGATYRPAFLYRHARSLFDITRGSNTLNLPPARVCGNDNLCTAKKNYDAPTGLGTPDGLRAF
ncbi:MAG: S8 family serine peptidase [Nocardiopsaceae bacterium]|jgi:hypothetical protein|nr:S8 family serine peptidase [Nocardiopsaceae bacterium]